MTNFVSKPKTLRELNIVSSISQEIPCHNGERYVKTSLDQIKSLSASPILIENFIPRKLLKNVLPPERIKIPKTDLNFFFRPDDATYSNDLDFSVLFTMHQNSVVTVLNADIDNRRDLNIHFKQMFDDLDPKDYRINTTVTIASGGYATSSTYRQVFTKDTTTPFVLGFGKVLEITLVSLHAQGMTDLVCGRFLALVQDY